MTSQRPTSLAQLVNPTDRQRDFLRAIADYDFVLYGGAAGGGKSYILRWWLVLYLVSLYKQLGLRNVQVAIFCEDYPSLHDRQISKIIFEFPHWLGDLKQGVVKNFQLKPEYGGGIIALRNLDDPSKYQSAEFAGIAVDELTKNPKETFDFLRFRLRWPGVERPKFAGATNPGGKGHAWVKKLWKEKSFPDELQDKADQFAFVQAKASDNPYLPSGYYKSLLTLPPDMARKFADGDWDIYTGQFYPQFTAARHVISRAEGIKRLKPWYTRWLSGDWGYFHPHCIHKLAKDENERVVIYGEIWGRLTTEAELAKRINELCAPELKAGIQLSAFPFSWDAFGKISPRSVAKIPQSITQLIAEDLSAGIPVPHPADSSAGTRVSGARLLAQMLDADMLSITDDCPRLIGCLPTLIRAEDNEEDVLKVDYAENEIGDDPYDSVRMGLQNMLGAAFKPIAIQRQEVLAGTLERTQDMTAVHMANMKFEQEHKHQFGAARRPARWSRR